MKILMKPLKGDSFEVEADEESKVEDLKKLITSVKPDMPAEAQKLIYDGKILQDSDLVSGIGIKEGKFIVVMVAKAKPPAAAAAPAAAPAESPTAPAETPAAPLAGANAAAVAEGAAVSGSGMESTVQQLCDMGFPREEVEKCLAAAFNNPDRAVEYLMNGIPQGILQETRAGAPAAEAGGGGQAPTPNLAAGATGEIPEALQQLRNNPQFAQLAAMVLQNPQMLAQMLPALQESNPDIVQAIQQNPQALMEMMHEAVGGGGGEGDDAEGAPPGTTVIRLTEEENAAVDRLAGLGFERGMAAQAYLACDKNEELAANFLFDSGDTGMAD